MDHRQSRWAQEILALQREDGTWGACFHSLAQPGKAPLTTEQAMRRLKALGFTIADEPIRRIVNTMSSCLRGERRIDGYWEKGVDWALYIKLMLGSWIRQFDLQNADALALARRWAGVIEAAFAHGAYDEAAYLAAYDREFTERNPACHRIGFTSFYHAPLLVGMLSGNTERAMLDYILTRPDGMYYIYAKPLIYPPAAFAAKETSYWLAALELLADYACAGEKLDFAAAWLYLCTSPDGQWDFGPKANDKVYFPLSDSWRSAEWRKADCTGRVTAFLTRITSDQRTMEAPC